MPDWNSFGQWINDITGKTAQLQMSQQFQRELRDTQLLSTVEQMKEAGLNPAMMYASGGTPMADAPSAPSASGSNAVFGILGDIAQAINSVTNARALDEKTHANEISAANASNLYKETAKIAKMLTKWYDE